MPQAYLTLSFANPPFFVLHQRSDRHSPFFSLSSKQRSSFISEHHKGNIFLLQVFSFFHGQPRAKSRKVIAFNRDSELPAKQEVELLDGVDKNARFSQFEESRNSRVFEEADENKKFSAKTREFEIKENAALLGFEELGVAYKEDTCSLDESNTFELDVSNALEKCEGIRQNEKDLGNLYPKDGFLMGLGRRGNRFNVVDLVKKIISLPDEESAKVLDLFDFDDKQFSVSDYNDILMALVKACEYESAEALFSECSSQGLSPDSRSFSTMIQCFLKKNDPEKAMEVLDVMLQKGMHPNSYTFTGLISCLCKKGRLKKAYEVFDTMGSVGCEPTLRNYNSLIYGLCYVGKVEEALQLLNKLKKFKQGPDIYSFTFVMNGFCKVGRTDDARELLEEALKFGLTSTNATHNCLINGYCKEGRPLKSFHLLKEMEGYNNFMPDITSYNTLLLELLKCGEIHAALWTFRKMREAGFQPDDHAINRLIRDLCNGEELKEAKELFEEIKDKDFGLSTYTYCLLVQALAEGGEIDTAMSYLKKMIEDGHAPAVITYNVVLHVLCGDGRVDDALGILGLMINRETMPSKFSLSILIDEFNRQGRLLEAAGVYSVAIKQGLASHHKPRRDWIYKKIVSYSLQLGTVE
ncbi:hypothetical protein KFK09_000889 [Dendrobium nobile]|uniref:Pentatricopeptide repeat-containing protein n=1 Tax=Dendrobium nobile TaxID=94219 RepID=A0A8T3CCC0_DENNO|nr:hypothetical protein KFK09_000889 [Dendrobium nobile]